MQPNALPFPEFINPMPDTSNEVTVIGGDTHIKGEITFQKTMRVVGTVEGSIQGEGELQVAKGAACKAQVDSSRLVVDGIIEGNVVARETVQLNASGVVKGDIVAGKMIMTEGASFFGQCSVGLEAVKAVKAPGQTGRPAILNAHPGESRSQPETARAK
jgi:cytoskeletal protein CcmA (bactofilin family)